MAGLIWNFLAPFFATPRTYSEVLSKLAGFAFYESYFITLFLRDIPEVNDLLRAAESYGHFGKAISSLSDPSTINAAGLVVAIGCAIISHFVHLHDRISDILGIRHRFDQEKILLPLAQLVGVNLSSSQRDALRQQRDRLMHAVFYPYASSRAANPLVDPHDIEHALAAWAWFWVCVEAVFFLGLALVAAIVFKASSLIFGFLVVIAIPLALAALQYPRLVKYARVQIETIASDPTAAGAVRAQFNAL
jgi:hypothetical protein